ncbi:MAG: hypothetical protein KJ043_17555 [Anaerolineae bacterium]|nr:hypothetical protein [Anaerolineae bacterium]
MAFFTPISAQSVCGDLSRDDCAILQNAQQATTNLNSAGFKATLEFDFGIGIFPDILNVRMVADGVYTRVPVTRDDIDDEYRLLYSLNADMTVFLEGEINEIIQPIDNSITTTFDLRYVDGVGYADLSKVFAPLNLSSGTWYSVDMTDFLTKLIRDAIFPSDTITIIDDLFSVDYMGGLGLDGSLSRLDDIQSDSQQFAVFEGVFSFGDYLDANPLVLESFEMAFENLIYDFLPNSNYTDAEIRDAAEFYANWSRALDIRILQTVGLDDGYVHQTQFEMTFASETTETLNPDPLGLALFSGIQLRILADFRYTQFGNVPLIIKPEQSSPLRYEDLFGDGDNSLF